jgi:hypothetical protein
MLGQPGGSTYRTVDDVVAATSELKAQGDRSAALELISGFTLSVLTDEASLGRIQTSRELSAICAALGRPFKQEPATEQNEDLAVFVVSTFRPVGGHSRLLLDIAEADPCKNAVVLLSNFERRQQPVEEFQQALRNIGSDVRLAVEAAPDAAPEERLQWLQARLNDLRPSRTYLLENPDDSVAIAACQPELVGQLFYLHHGDHSLSLGAHLAGATHVDLTSKCFDSCRNIEGIAGNVYWPLCPSVPSHRGDKPFLHDGNLRSATCGTANKFDSWYLAQSAPYTVRYAEIVPLVLGSTVDTHVHIGEMTASMLEEIQERLKSAAIDERRFVYLPFVPSLSQALLDLNIDVYIGSFPVGGGTTTTEVMGTGVPPIIYSNYRNERLSTTSEVYDGAMIWRTPEELELVLSDLNPAVLEKHSGKARRFYETYHSPKVFRERFEATLQGKPLPPPPSRPSYRSDPLQTFLDEQIGEEQRRADAVTAERARLTAIQEAELEVLTARHNAELERMHALHTARLQQIHEEQCLHVAQLQQERAEHAAQLNQLQQECAKRATQLKRQLSDFNAESASLQTSVNNAIQDRDSFRASLDAMRASHAWKLTGPLRAVLDRLSRTRK